MMMNFSIISQRSMSDLLDAERTMRARDEALIRDLQQALIEIAIRFDGERFESLRRGDPGVPAAWTVENWRTFFSQVSLAGRGWNAPELKFQREQRELLQQIEGLQAQVRLLEMQLEQELSSRLAENSDAAVSPKTPVPDLTKSKAMPRAAIAQAHDDDIVPPLDKIIADVQSLAPNLSRKAPAPFDKVLDGGSRTGAILDQVFPRYWIMVYLMGRWKLSTWLEMDIVVSSVAGIKPGAGSMHRMMEDLIEKNFVVSEMIRSPYTSLALHRLSPEGDRLFEALFHAKPVENEWARIIRLHQGEREPQHTMNIIAFTNHARRRGYSTRVLPESKETPTPPDLWVSRDGESLFVEVELSQKENPAKWRNQAKLNNGKVAICAGTSAQREALVSDCKAMHLTGYATDLETTVKKKFKTITLDDPLWLEMW